MRRRALADLSAGGSGPGAGTIIGAFVAVAAVMLLAVLLRTLCSGKERGGGARHAPWSAGNPASDPASFMSSAMFASAAAASSAGGCDDGGGGAGSTGGCAGGGAGGC